MQFFELQWHLKIVVKNWVKEFLIFSKKNTIKYNVHSHLQIQEMHMFLYV